MNSNLSLLNGSHFLNLHVFAFQLGLYGPKQAFLLQMVIV